MKVVIVGAGAAGCFAAVEIKRRMPSADVTVVESGRRPLAKVAVTGGGRCNLTNSFEGVAGMESVYPRGARIMKRLLKEFSHKDAYRWFESAGVRLTTQADHCVFPVSQDAMEIVNTLLNLMRHHDVKSVTQQRITRIERTESDANEVRYRLYAEQTAQGERMFEATHVVVTTGGSPRIGGMKMYEALGLDIVEPVPSLFSFCLPNHPITQLMGTVVDNTSITLTGTKMKASGPLLITHWGISGPAVLKLSSYAARHLKEHDYKAVVSVNWFGQKTEAEVTEMLLELSIRNAHKQLHSVYPSCLNSRLWMLLLESSGLRGDQRWGELARKSYCRLASRLTSHTLQIDGKNKFKEEFVTCGGVALGNVNASTLECRTLPGVYFAGEVLDVDAITGGFNLQAAWTMAYVVAKSCSESMCRQ